MTEKEKIEKRLQDAEKAYFEIISGNGIRTLVDQNGERIEYGIANLPRLAAYIVELKISLGRKPVSGPMRVFF